MAKQATKPRTFPWSTKIDGVAIKLRLLTEDDRDALVEFGRGLSEEDLRFLSFDITSEAFVDHWIRRVRSGLWYTILVEADGQLVGHGSLMRTEQVWSRHLGEIMLLLSPTMRGKGLGNILAGEIFAKADEWKLMKVVARMAADQKGAIQVFEKLGFNAEALLADYVIDRNNRTHDLIAMSYDITGFTTE